MKRRFFQIHLLTAVVGMLTFSVFVGANLTVFRKSKVFWQSKGDYTEIVGMHSYWMGWPERTAAEIPDFDVSNFMAKSQIGDRSPKAVLLKQLEPVPKSLAKTEHLMLVAPLQSVQQFAPDVIDKIQWMQNEPELPSWRSDWVWKSIEINVVVAIATTLLLMIGFEWVLRRRERAKI
jgi:hypothetical protein